MLSDTSPEAAQVQLELLRQATPEKRLAMTLSLTATAWNLSRRAIARANPDLDRRELDLLVVRYNYGDRLADELRDHLQRKEP